MSDDQGMLIAIGETAKKKESGFLVPDGMKFV